MLTAIAVIETTVTLKTHAVFAVPAVLIVIDALTELATPAVLVALEAFAGT